MRLKNAELNIIIFNSRLFANTETRLPCFDENLHIVWQEGRLTSATDRDIPEAYVSRKATWIREQWESFLIVIFDRFLPCKGKNDQRETTAFTGGKFQHFL